MPAELESPFACRKQCARCDPHGGAAALAVFVARTRGSTHGPAAARIAYGPAVRERYGNLYGIGKEMAFRYAELRR